MAELDPRRRQSSIHRMTWRDYTLRVELIRNHRVEGWTLVVVDVVDPPGAPLPVGHQPSYVTGLEEERLSAAGGARAMLTKLFDEHARGWAWEKAQFRFKQGDLFSR